MGWAADCARCVLLTNWADTGGGSAQERQLRRIIVPTYAPLRS
eukprot:gene7829-24669_t